MHLNKAHVEDWSLPWQLAMNFLMISQCLLYLWLLLHMISIAYIKSKWCYRFRAAAEITFVRLWYAESLHFGPNCYFLFSKIARQACCKHAILLAPIDASWKVLQASLRRFCMTITTRIFDFCRIDQSDRSPQEISRWLVEIEYWLPLHRMPSGWIKHQQ